MEFKEVYTDFNEFYYYRLNDMVNSSSKENDCPAAKFFKEINEKGIDLHKVIYKKLVDDYEEVEINSKKVGLLPMGLKNHNVPEFFIRKEERKHAGRYGSIGVFIDMFLNEAHFGPLYYHARDSFKQVFGKICASYIDHYKETLNEVWSEKDFYARLADLSYLTVKYAKDLETGEIFAIGFFGSLVKNGAGGKMLTDAELYVMPEFRKMGIAKRMVGLSFELAKSDGIMDFDSITYRVPSCDALSFWQRIGASVTGLTHIEGNIPEIIEVIDESSKKNKHL